MKKYVPLFGRQVQLRVPTDEKTRRLCMTACVNPDMQDNADEMLRNVLLGYQIARRCLVGVTKNEVMSLTVPQMMTVLSQANELAKAKASPHRSN